MSEATYRLGPHQTLTVKRSSADVLEVEATWSGDGALPPAHFHPDQDEHFEVLDGQLRVLLDGEERLLGPGDTLDVPRGTVHAMTATHDGARAIWQTRPAMRTEQFFAAMDAAQHRGGSLLDFAPVARAHTAEVRFTKPPRWLQGPLFAVLAMTARLLRR